MQILIRSRAAGLLVFVWAAIAQGVPPIQSNFDLNNEGWTQTDLDGDIRYVVPVQNEEGDPNCPMNPPAGGGILWLRDPDAGEWLFDAPSKFLGDQSARFGGTIQWRQRWTGCDLGEPPEPYFRVFLISSNTGLVRIMAPPQPNEWVQEAVRLDEQEGWLWVDDTTGQEDLPPATKSQIQQVLQNLTAFRILGEFITGNDAGGLDDVIFSGPTNVPQLMIRHLPTNHVEVTWSAPDAGFVLEAKDQLGTSSPWTIVDTGGKTNVAIKATGNARFFRLHKPSSSVGK